MVVVRMIKRRQIGEMFGKRKFDLLAQSETKFKGKGDREVGVVSRRESGVEESWA